MSEVLRDNYVSIDVEASGGSPSIGSLISIGACLVEDPTKTFYVELIPDNPTWDKEAEKIHGLTKDYLFKKGARPVDAMNAFAKWLNDIKSMNGRRVTFVGWSATFDWMFVNDYFLKYLGKNPFGVSGMDLKAFYLGKHWPETCKWSDTAKRPVYDRYPVNSPHTHNALDDAVEQAELARRLMEIGEFEGVKARPLDRKRMKKAKVY